MAGIGVKLHRIFDKESISANLVGMGYGSMVTIAPMFVVIGTIMLMQKTLSYETVGYAQRALFSATVLYIFIFSMLIASPFNAVLSRYMSDVIYEESYGDILPCFYAGLLINMAVAGAAGIPFCIREYLAGGVDLVYIFTGFCGYISLVFVFYAMLYLSICKDYQKISLFFLTGMAFAYILSQILVRVAGVSIAYSMLLALTCGFFLIAVLEYALIKRYFKKNSGRYLPVFLYFKKFWKLVAANLFYTLGLFIHNFVFWGSDLRMVTANTFVLAPSYDLATCLAMFTNLSATVIFIVRVEMYFHERYKAYSEAVIGGRWEDIKNAKDRMFRQLSGELMNLVRVQFIITVALFLFLTILLPRFGFSGMVMRIYPCLAVGYFILFIQYAELIFLYYYNDLNGAMYTAFLFCSGTFLGSLVSMRLPELWYGAGLVCGAFLGFTAGYFRLRWVECHMDEHIFCQGILFPVKRGKRPPDRVYGSD